MFTGINAIIFDLDGTLIDSMWMWKEIDVTYLSRFGRTLPERFQSKIEGMSFTETALFFKDYFKIPDSIEQMKAEWNEMAWEIYRTEVKCKPGVIELLEYCKKNKIKTGIATSNSKELAELVLDSLHLKEYFDSIHTSCEVERGKPSPDIYLLVARDLNVLPEACLVFEDVPQGIRAGKSAGMKVCAVADDFSKHVEEEKRELADYWIDDFIQLELDGK